MERERPIDAAFLTDMVSALAREFGTDPAWLLTGEYDAELHQHALVLSEDRSPAGVRALRDFIRDEYSRFLESETIRLPPARPADHGRRSRGSGSE
jgi:hypothetical protein